MCTLRISVWRRLHSRQLLQVLATWIQLSLSLKPLNTTTLCPWILSRTKKPHFVDDGASQDYFYFEFMLARGCLYDRRNQALVILY